MIYLVTRKIETVEEYVVEAANEHEARSKIGFDSNPTAINNKTMAPEVIKTIDEDETEDWLLGYFPEDWSTAMIERAIEK